MEYRIKSPKGFYFRDWTYLGPRFGDKKDAQIYDEESDAQLEIDCHIIGFAGCVIDPVCEEVSDDQTE